MNSDQQEELNALSAIYGSDFQSTRTAGGEVTLSFDNLAEDDEGGEGGDASLRLKFCFLLPLNYPRLAPPSFELRDAAWVSPKLRQIVKNGLCEVWEEQLEGEEGQKQGQVVLFQWILWLKDNLRAAAQEAYREKSKQAETTQVVTQTPPPETKVTLQEALVVEAQARHREKLQEQHAHLQEPSSSSSIPTSYSSSASFSACLCSCSLSSSSSPPSSSSSSSSSYSYSSYSSCFASCTCLCPSCSSCPSCCSTFALPIHVGDPLTDRKSVFQARVAVVRSAEDVQQVMSHLLSDRHIARATHNISAYRIILPKENGNDSGPDLILKDNDDDGETAAGARLAHLLDLTNAQNVLVVVSRWYGGIHLGPDRFKHINNVARTLLAEQGFLQGTRGKYSATEARPVKTFKGATEPSSIKKKVRGGKKKR
eukprot:gb/GEZN01004905.1/.p1 GENE.gb/GEZN01004905.1/~~gb/GEZN01004905.1/.p1  ORF type:complete len:425 (-),score=120.53 gb/GEZN01004905.1/:178-1452(-)